MVNNKEALDAFNEFNIEYTKQHDGRNAFKFRVEQTIRALLSDEVGEVDIVVGLDLSNMDRFMRRLTTLDHDSKEYKEAVKLFLGSCFGFMHSGGATKCRQALTPKLDVESLKKKVFYSAVRPAEGVRLGDDEREMKGWNDCIDHLQAQGYLTPPGMVLVPLEATQAIQTAVEDNIDGSGILYDSWYGDMIKAVQDKS